jgi:molecular chaperone GrpE
MSGMGREEILQRFGEWLDSALAAEEPPRGVDAEILAAMGADSRYPTHSAPSDAYSLWAATTALTQEVKLQGRSFKELNDTLGAQERRMAERERDLVRETERRCRKEVLGVLIDLRDRLGRGLESVRVSEGEILKTELRGWRERLFAKLFRQASEDAAGNVIPALKKGYEMGLERLDQTLEEFNAREIPCEGQAFDPQRMNAIDRQESGTLPEGTVIEVYRSGYEWNGELFRPAQVKVSCAPARREK